MTHTNHRYGTRNSLQEDFVVLVMPAKGYNDDSDAPEKLRKIFDILISYNPVNAGGINAGNLFLNSPQQIRGRIGTDTPMIHGVYTDKETVSKVIAAVKTADTGLSVVVTGLIDEVDKVAESLGLSVHSRAYSLGILGNRNLLPSQPVLEVTSMCGHGLIPSARVEQLLDELSAGKLNIQQAVKSLGTHCVCGVFNPTRAAHLLEKAAAQWKGVKFNESTV